jgi:hypothetical protein
VVLLLVAAGPPAGAYFPLASNVRPAGTAPEDQRVIILKWPALPVNLTVAGSHDPVLSGPDPVDQLRTGVVDDTHPLIVDGSDPIRVIRDAIAAWSNIPGSALRYLERATPGAVDANVNDRINLITFADTPANRAHFSGPNRNGISLTIFTHNPQGDLLDVDMIFNAHQPPPPVVSAVPTPVPAPTPRQPGDPIFFKYTTTGVRDTFDDPRDFDPVLGNRVLVHLNTIFYFLIAKLAGIDQSAVVSSITFTRTSAQAVQDAMRIALAPDDIAAAIATYPVGTFARAGQATGRAGYGKPGVGFVPEVPPGGAPGAPRATLGGLAGRVTFNLDGVFGAHVVAEAIDGSAVVGNLTLQDGSYSILGLPPGRYRVYAEPLDGPRTHRVSTAFPTLLGGFDERVNVGFRTTFLGGNASPQIVAVTAGAVTQLSDIPVDRIGRIVDPATIGIATTLSAAPAQDLKLELSPGDTLIAGVTGFGLASATGVFVNGPGVTIDTSQFQVGTLGGGVGFVNFRVAVAADAPLGNRSVFVQSGDNLSALSGALVIRPRSSLRAELTVNGRLFREGDLMVLRANLDNQSAQAQPADAYLSLECPDSGRRYWTGRELDAPEAPFARGVTIPPRESKSGVELLRGPIPPGLGSGPCHWRLELREPGTSAPIGETAVTEVTLTR